MKTEFKKKLKGIVVSQKGNKTAIVLVERYRKHPLFRKFMKRSKRYKAHDENNEYKEGDVVFIQESRPISKEKNWVVISKVGVVSPKEEILLEDTMDGGKVDQNENNIDAVTNKD